MDISSLYPRRPDPEYRLAFDLALQSCASAPGVLALLSSPAWAVELLRRLSSPLALAGAGAFSPSAFLPPARAWALGPLELYDPHAHKTYPALLWAEPEGPGLLDSVQLLSTAAAPGASLAVIASGPLLRFLPAWQEQPKPARQPPSPLLVSRLLRSHAWQLERRLALHGPRSLLCARLARLSVLLARPDWGDRWLFTSRSLYREPGWLWPLATLSISFFRKVP